MRCHKFSTNTSTQMFFHTSFFLKKKREREREKYEKRYSRIYDKKRSEKES
jgi:hypothetical protein